MSLFVLVNALVNENKIACGLVCEKSFWFVHVNVHVHEHVHERTKANGRNSGEEEWLERKSV